MFGDDFVGKPKNSVYYDMLKFARYCAYISALGVKSIKTKGKQCLDQDTFKQHSRPTNYYHRQRVMVFNVTITIGAIISAQPLGSIIFRWFSDNK